MKFFFSSAIFSCWPKRYPRRCETAGRGGGVRTPTRGFGDRWAAVKPTPLGHTPRRSGGHPLILLDFLVSLVLAAMTAELTEFDTFCRGLLILGRRIIPVLALRALERNDFAWHLFHSYFTISLTVPAPTVRPPSRIANRNPLSMATGVINSTSRLTLSPGITISVPSGNCATPVTSVVRK